MNRKLINIGFGSFVMIDKIISIVNPDSAPIKRLVQNARENDRLIDATYGRKTRAVIIISTGQIILSGIQVETIAGRMENNRRKRKNQMRKGILIIISGFSGAGKGTIVKELIKNKDFCLSISATTRGARER